MSRHAFYLLMVMLSTLWVWSAQAVDTHPCRGCDAPPSSTNPTIRTQQLMRQSLQAVVGGYCLPGASPAPVTIEPRAAAVGDTIEVSGRTYIMTEMEVPGFQTDEVYIVTFPTYVQTISDRIVIISVLVTFWERRGNAEDFLPNRHAPKPRRSLGRHLQNSRNGIPRSQ